MNTRTLVVTAAFIILICIIGLLVIPSFQAILYALGIRPSDMLLNRFFGPA